MELYLDTANVAEVERLARIFPIGKRAVRTVLTK